MGFKFLKQIGHKLNDLTGFHRFFVSGIHLSRRAKDTYACSSLEPKRIAIADHQSGYKRRGRLHGIAFCNLPISIRVAYEGISYQF